ncbi:MAG: tRNA (N6-isopentenyl adenosine(37)-C2)-methylthiotransferase MiaB [Deferrisomatales bacterium]|nr:tRNA (N6-isopentenyl adenosine(37)-C2)-methylthiotransferase MiaB [Deferrisomatales bacterium]
MDNLRFYIQTFGCQMNDHDSAVLARLLEEQGHLEVETAEGADVILLNTCAIRERAEQKVYSQLGRYRFLKEKRPEIVLGVGGCVAQGEGRKVLRRAPYVDLVFGTRTLHRVPELVEAVRSGRRQVVATALDDDPVALATLYAHAAGRGPRAYVTVMQGCDNYCAYCVVPYVRGRELSRPADELVEEVRRLAAEGVVEVTLLGQNVNSYGQKPPGEVDFPSLLRHVAAVDGIRRVRFTTSHPKDLSDDLIRAFAEVPGVMPHIHLPVQSGADRVLTAMNRRYTVAHYLGLVERLRRLRPDIALTSDLIVGFPGETDAEFEATLALMEQVVFDGLFSFKYSLRPGTRAAELTDPVPEAVKEERLARLQRLQGEHSLRRNRAMEGQVFSVLVEGGSKVGDGQVMGRTPQNKIVNFAGEVAWRAREVPVRVTAAAVNSSRGEAVGPAG